VSGNFEDGPNVAWVGAAFEYVAAFVAAIVQTVVRIAHEQGPPLQREVDRTRPVPFAFKVRDRDASMS
jgi:hypothetical protein